MNRKILLLLSVLAMTALAVPAINTIAEDHLGITTMSMTSGEEIIPQGYARPSYNEQDDGKGALEQRR